MKKINDDYMGDGVYASFDGERVWLDLRAQDSTTRIALEPETFESLCRYASRAWEPEPEVETEAEHDAKSEAALAARDAEFNRRLMEDSNAV